MTFFWLSERRWGEQPAASWPCSAGAVRHETFGAERSIGGGAGEGQRSSSEETRREAELREQSAKRKIKMALIFNSFSSPKKFFSAECGSPIGTPSQPWTSRIVWVTSLAREAKDFLKQLCFSRRSREWPGDRSRQVEEIVKKIVNH